MSDKTHRVDVKVPIGLYEDICDIAQNVFKSKIHHISKKPELTEALINILTIGVDYIKDNGLKKYDSDTVSETIRIDEQRINTLIKEGIDNHLKDHHHNEIINNRVLPEIVSESLINTVSETDKAIKDQAPSPETYTQQGLEDVAPELALSDSQGNNTPENENKAILGDFERAKIETFSDNVDFENIKDDCASEAVAVEAVSSTAPMERLEGSYDSNSNSNSTNSTKEKLDREALENDFKESIKNIPLGQPLTLDNDQDLLLMLIELMNNITPRTTIDKKVISKVAGFRVNEKAVYKSYAMPSFFWEYIDVKNINEGQKNKEGRPKNALWQWTRIK